MTTCAYMSPVWATVAFLPMATSKKSHHLVLADDRPRASHPHNQQIRSFIRRGDYREQLADVPTGAVDCVITDPPYGVTDLAYDRDKLDLDEMWDVIDRITKPEAMIVVFTCQPFTTAVINGRPKAFRYELIWEKNTVTGFLSAKKRPLRSHENILVFCKRFAGSTYNPQMEAGKPYRGAGGNCALYRKNKKVESINTGTRYPRTVRHAESVAKGRIHPSEKPLELLRWLVMTYSQQADLICDPFMGSASCGQASIETGRRFLGVERDAEFYKRARRRLIVDRSSP